MRYSEILLTVMVLLLMASNWIIAGQRDKVVQSLQHCVNVSTKQHTLLVELDSVIVDLNEIRSDLYGEGPK